MAGPVVTMTKLQYFGLWALAFVGFILPLLYVTVKWAIIAAALYLKRHP